MPDGPKSRWRPPRARKVAGDRGRLIGKEALPHMTPTPTQPNRPAYWGQGLPPPLDG